MVTLKVREACVSLVADSMRTYENLLGLYPKLNVSLGVVIRYARRSRNRQIGRVWRQCSSPVRVVQDEG